MDEGTVMSIEKVLVLRTCANNMADHCGLVWPVSGPVECKHWQPTKGHENGLSGLLWGAGTSAFLSVHADAQWVVCEVVVADIIELPESGMVKFQRAQVVHVGDKSSAAQYLLMHKASYLSASNPATVDVRPASGELVVSHEVFDVASVVASASSGNNVPAVATQTLQTATYGSTLSGDSHSQLVAGYGSTETAGDHSDLTAGYGSTGTAGSDSSLTAGYGSTQTSGSDSSLRAGYGSTQTAQENSHLTAGYGSTGTAGSDSSLIAGYGSTQTSGGDSALTAGYGSTQTAQEGSDLTAGYGSTG
ncbi:Ice nucleation protein, partial [Pseudomonas syringae pv. tagetis]